MTLHQLTLPADGTATSAAVILVFKPGTLQDSTNNRQALMVSQSAGLTLAHLSYPFSCLGVSEGPLFMQDLCNEGLTGMPEGLTAYSNVSCSFTV